MKLFSCAFNMDTACVELKFADSSMIAIEATTDAVNTMRMNGLSWTI